MMKDQNKGLFRGKKNERQIISGKAVKRAQQTLNGLLSTSTGLGKTWKGRGTPKSEHPGRGGGGGGRTLCWEK